MKGKIRCNQCGKEMSSSGSCSKCGKNKCHIVVYAEGQARKYYQDAHGDPFQYNAAYRQLAAMNQEMLDERFKWQAWVPGSIKGRKMKNAMQAYLDDIKERVKEGVMSVNTFATYRTRITTCILHPEYGIGEKDIRDITTFEIGEFRNRIPAHYSRQTHTSTMVVLHSFFVWAKGRCLIETSPEFEKVTPKQRRGRITKKRTALSVSQLHDALQNIPERYRDIFEFASETGTRPGETCALQIRDINFETQELTVQRTFVSKSMKQYVSYVKESDKGRHSEGDDQEQQLAIIPLSPRAFEIVQRHAAGKFPNDWLFTNPLGKVNTHYTVNYLARVWNECSKSGVTHYEGTRHTFCTLIVNTCGDVTLAQLLLRHSSLQSTQRYVHHPKDALRKALAARSMRVEQHKNNIVDIQKRKEAKQG